MTVRFNPLSICYLKHEPGYPSGYGDGFESRCPCGSGVRIPSPAPFLLLDISSERENRIPSFNEFQQVTLKR